MMMKGVVLDDNMSNLTCASNEASISSSSRNEIGTMYTQQSFASPNQPPPAKKKRNLPGNPDPDAEVVALSPKSLMATNRFLCEICNKGFQRDQNLQLHRRGHNLPWKLKQRSNKEVIKKKVYVCPESTCVHHDPSRALGDLTGIKKHFSRKHGEKKWKCEKCSKRYAVQSDWKAHSKICGTREYRCDCGTLFSRRDSFITHRAFCDALAEESSRSAIISPNPLFLSSQTGLNNPTTPINNLNLQAQVLQHNHNFQAFPLKREHSLVNLTPDLPPWLVDPSQGQPTVDLSSPQLFSPRLDQSYMHQENPKPNPSPHMSATALLQKAAQMGVTVMSSGSSTKSCPSSTSEAMLISGPHQDHMATTTTGSTTGLMISSSSPSFVHGLASFESKTSLNHGCMEQPMLLHDHMVMCNSLSSSSNGGFDGSSFEEALNGMLNPKPPREGGGGDGGGGGGGGGGRGGGGDGLTRDFLGLKAFPQRGFPNLNMGGLDQISSSSSYNHQQNQNQNQNQTSWQG